jgi:hypothetical protein
VKPVGADEPGWKARFRVPRILGIQVAADVPTRGLVTSNVSGTFQLHAWDVPGGRLRALTTRLSGTASGLLAPDGRYVYYHDDSEGNEIGHFVRIPFEGGAPVSITPGLPPYPTFGLAVSGTGNRLGFVTASGGSYHLHVIEVDAGGTLGPPQRIHSCSRLLIGPVFSHDGAIAVVAVSAGAGSFQFGLVALDMATGRTVAELADADSRLGAVAFAPLSGDARLVAWTNRTGVSRPLVWNVVGGTRADIALDWLKGEIYPADWSPDGRRVLLFQFARAVQRLHVYNVARPVGRLHAPAASDRVGRRDQRAGTDTAAGSRRRPLPSVAVGQLRLNRRAADSRLVGDAGRHRAVPNHPASPRRARVRDD